MIGSLAAITLEGNFSPLFILGALIISLCFAGWSYYTTKPPVKRWIQRTLIALRSLTFFGAFWLLWQPTMVRVFNEPHKFPVAVLIDRSLSMGAKDGDTNRWEQVVNLFRSSTFQHLRNVVPVTFFSFGDSLRGPFSEPPLGSNPNEPYTDLSIALDALAHLHSHSEKVGGSPFQGVVVVTDGVITRGPDPLRIAPLLRTPIWTIGVGSETSLRDVMVTKAEVNPVVYKGTKVPVKINLRAIESQILSSTITLWDENGKLLNSSDWLIQSPFEEKEVNFEVVPRGEGKVRWDIVVGTVEGERNEDNNRFSLVINVLKSQVKILILSGPPDNGLGDLVRRCAADPNVELIVRTMKGGSFYEGAWLTKEELKAIDAVILHHFPARGISEKDWNRMVDDILDLKLPVALIDGGKLEPRLLGRIVEILPIEPTGRAGNFKRAEVLPISSHAIISPPEEQHLFKEWVGLPPLLYAEGLWKVKTHSEVLAVFASGKSLSQKEKYFSKADRTDEEVIEKKGDSPMLVVYQKGSTRSVAILARDVWRWGMVPHQENSIWPPLLSRIIRWLTLRQELQQVNIQLPKETWNNQESVPLRVVVYDENFVPWDGLEVVISVQPEGEDITEFHLVGTGKGIYQGTFTPWKEGLWKLKAIAKRENQIIGDASTTFLVERFSVEYLDLRMNTTLLKSLASLTGGSFSPIENADTLLSHIEVKEQILRRELRYPLWGKTEILILLICILTAEWVIRMRTGML